MGVFPPHVGQGHWAGSAGPSSSLLGRRLAHSKTQETSRGLLGTRCIAGMIMVTGIGSKKVFSFPHFLSCFSLNYIHAISTFFVHYFSKFTLLIYWYVYTYIGIKILKLK